MKSLHLGALLRDEPLDREAVEVLGRRIKDLSQKTDPDSLRQLRLAVSTLVQANLRMVLWIARRYTHGPIPQTLDELVSDGYTHLLEKAQRFDVDRGYRFSTFAIFILKRRFERSAGYSGASEAFMWHRIVSKSPDNAGWNGLSNLAVSRDPEVVEAPDLSGLSRRQRQVIELRFGLGGRPELTMDEVGKILGVTRQAVDQIEKRAIERLRSKVSDPFAVGRQESPERQEARRKRQRRQFISKWLYGQSLERKV